jgi:SAM-dependent methyltransferase
MGFQSEPPSLSQHCQACGETNPSGRLFCHRCTAPLSVVSLNELNAADLAECGGALIDVLSRVQSLANAPVADQPPLDEELWSAYLRAFWLRPETALVLYAEALAVQSIQNEAVGPWLDLGCGDGIHAALMAGWRFDAAFDAFQSLDPSAKDVYHHFNAGKFSSQVTRRGRAATWGIDIKPTAVTRAGALGVFGQALQADATRLPLEDNSVSVIFSNMLRDLGDPLPASLAECARVLREDGRLLLSAMTPAYPSTLHFAPDAREAEMRGDLDRASALLRLDRGRSVFCQRQLSVEQWNELLQQAGLEVAQAIPVAGHLVMRFWDVGLRPFTSTLLSWRQHWASTGRLSEVKQQALALLRRWLDPLARQLHWGATAMHLLAIRKR